MDLRFCLTVLNWDVLKFKLNLPLVVFSSYNTSVTLSYSIFRFLSRSLFSSFETVIIMSVSGIAARH